MGTRARRWAAVMVALATLPARADEPPPVRTAAEAAAAVHEAVTRGDDAALVALAEQDEPDPWLVADLLCERGERDAALAFARAAPRVAVETLPDVLDRWRATDADAGMRARLSTAEEALSAGRAEDAAHVLAGLDPDDASILDVRLRRLGGTALLRLRRWEEAAGAEHATAERATALGWVVAAAAAHHWEAYAATMLQDHARARAGWEAALALRERLEQPGEVALAECNLARACLGVGDVVAARDHAARGLALAQGEGNDRLQSLAHVNLGSALFLLGEYRNALREYEEGEASARASGDDESIARAITNRAAALGQLGEHATAAELSREAHRLKLALHDEQGALIALLNLGMTELVSGAWAHAEATLVEALASARGSGFRLGELQALLLLVEVAARIGDWQAAAGYMEAALAVAQATGQKAREAQARGASGALRLRMGEYEAAARDFAEARDTALREGAPAVAIACEANLGFALHRLGRDEEALPRLEAAAQAAHESGDVDGHVRTLVSIEQVLTSMDATERALELGRRARDEARAAHAAESFVLASWALARTHAARSDSRAVLASVRDAIEALPRLSHGLDDTAGAITREQFMEVFELGEAAALAEHDADAALFVLESERAQSLLEVLHGRDAVQAATLDPALRLDEAATRLDEASAMSQLAQARRAGAIRELREASQAYEQARDAHTAIVRRIQREARAGPDLLYAAPASLAEAQASVAADEALLLYVLHDALAAAVVVRRDGARVVDLGPGATVRASCREVLDGLSAEPASAARPDAPAAAALDEKVRRLSDLVATRLHLEDDVQRILVSPQGELGYVPFTLLFPGRDVAYVPSATTYDRLRPEGALRGTDVLGLGDPAYGTTGAQRAPAIIRGGLASDMTRLPGTRLEVEAVADVRLLGADATEARLRETLPLRERWRAVHLACHGRANTAHGGLSMLILPPDDENDGLLTALDVFTLRVPADLVTLSACETAVGRLYEVEGIVGLARSFMFAGAPRVLCSLWRVDDEATRALMTRFYALWNPKEGAGIGAAAALEQAQEHVRSQERWRHPRYWAAWVLWGLPN